ncbi:hypothetical protein [Thioclava indica]|uniref:Uncharacterized protein n=1 Tax=Thioclava indica TaxID=1353528 RepID=A0A074JVD5_9RHOB|nr:hypothetical protein [Thioclava indica]KEO60454.1 hypothetical protein DT23_02915 [Thioclava indica]
MDRISGLMPQTGWSPLLSPATPKNAPATTVEPAATSADTNGGKSAGTDTQTAQDHAQTARLFRGIAAAHIASGETQSEPVGPPPDPNAPSGPMPTFDVSPLEEAAARVMAVPAMAGDMAASETSEAVETPESLGKTSEQDSAIKESSQSGEATLSAAVTQDAAPDTSAAQQWQARPWPQTPQTNASQLDVTR